jgi:hypothetical protein
MLKITYRINFTEAENTLLKLYIEKELKRKTEFLAQPHTQEEKNTSMYKILLKEHEDAKQLFLRFIRPF